MTEKTPTKAELQERVEAVERERDEYLDSLQRLKAEFDNYRKRVARDQQELAARAHERLVRELVPVLDDLERALEFATAHEEAQLEDGVRLVHRALADALGAMLARGVEERAAAGRAGRAFVLERASVEREAAKLSALISRASASARARSGAAAARRRARRSARDPAPASRDRAP